MTAARLLTGARKFEHISLILASLSEMSEAFYLGSILLG